MQEICWVVQDKFEISEGVMDVVDGIDVMEAVDTGVSGGTRRAWWTWDDPGVPRFTDLRGQAKGPGVK